MASPTLLIAFRSLRLAVSCVALCSLILTATTVAKGAEPILVTMTAESWQAKENAEFVRQLGFYRGLLRLNSGVALLKGVAFAEGTIEFDVNTISRGSPGIAFGAQDDDNFELFYLRPDPACPAYQACISMRHAHMGFCYGTSFRIIRRGRHFARMVGTTSEWSCPAGA